LQPYVVLRATVEGRPDPATGYLCNIKLIDDVLRGRSIPLVNRMAGAEVAATGDPEVQEVSTGERLILAIAATLAGQAPPGTRWVEWQLNLTPFLSFAVGADAMSTVRVTQCFEFAAAHRLHCPSLSDVQNREVFGKCNNPNGHGHNYQLEVTVSGEPDARSGVVLPVTHMERVVKERVIDRFDHKHLNLDCAEFRELNPSVEHITRVIWGLLEGQFAPARLARVRVWETGKTYAEYEG
jgi:6-pyruvoyltetrahydropterin/6-carboxytetrahydropterin synthase